MIKEYFGKNILFLFTFVYVSFFMLFTVFSSENHSSIRMICQFDGKSIESMEIRLYKVADIINGEIVVKSSFDRIETDLKQLTDTEDSKGVAERVQSLIMVSDLKPDKISKTDKIGKVAFSQLEEGVYYIDSVKYLEEDKEYMITPVVLSVPQKKPGANGVYDIDVIPKIVERDVEETSKTSNVSTEEITTEEWTTIEETTKTNNNPKLPQTGLKTMDVVLIGCFGIILIWLGVRLLKYEE